MIDNLGDRMKAYENPKAQARFLPMVPIVARIDGRSFSKFTKGLKRPYDKTMTECMIATTRHLVNHTGAIIGYTQSDEITLVFLQPNTKAELWFAGREQKMVSQLAAQATVAFNALIRGLLSDQYVNRMPTFDARVFQVPNQVEAANCLVWREWDATKNSITMAASEYYSHKQLMGKSGAEKIAMLKQKGVVWEDYPAEFKRGTYVKRTLVKRKLTTDELQALPEKHHARQNPDLEFERHVIENVWPQLSKVHNRVDWIFGNAEPMNINGKILDVRSPE